MRTDKMSYSDVAEWFTRCRNPDKGRPVMSWARMFKVDDTYELRHGSTKVGVFTPDNKFTFTLSTQEARNSSVTLSQALQRTIPFSWHRVGMGKYKVKPTPPYEEYKANNPDAYPWHYFAEQEGYELFDGLCFDLNTYEPVNARPKMSDTIDPVKRKEWLGSLRKFKRAVKVRARLGVLDTLIQQVAQERSKHRSRYDWEMPDWNTDTWQDMLYTSIKNSECSTELLKGIVMSVSTGYYKSSISVDDVLKECDKICTNYSVEIRRKFGVFNGDINEVSSMQHKNEMPRHTVEQDRESDKTQVEV
jgi:hypothetical protein